MRLNGRTITLSQEQSLLEFLTEQQFDYRLVAVEHNGAIVPKRDYARLRVTDGDTLEIVRFVGGG